MKRKKGNRRSRRLSERFSKNKELIIDNSLDFGSAIYTKRKRNRKKIIAIAGISILIIFPFSLKGVHTYRLYKLDGASEESGNIIIDNSSIEQMHNKKDPLSDIDGDSNGVEDYDFNSNSIQDKGDNEKDKITSHGKKDVDDELNTDSEKGVDDELSIDSEKDVKDELNIDDENKDDKIKEKTGKYSEKKVYLTFDDGPSIFTSEILDILNNYDAKATFFVNGKEDDNSKAMYKRIVDEGHTLAMHSYSHDYGEIYNSLKDFDKDFTKLWNLLYDVTGYEATIFRFPGGSLNGVSKMDMKQIVKYLNEKSIVYYDWNVINGDATGKPLSKKEAVQNVIEGVESYDTSIVLMHDSQNKRATVDSLPVILKRLTKHGADVVALDEESPKIQMINAKNVK